MNRRPWLVAVLLVSGALALPGPAAATSGCDTQQRNYFDGFHTRDYTTYGSEASIVTVPGSLCTTSSGQPGTSAAWAMIAGKFNDPVSGYSQAGYAKIRGSSNRYFAQSDKNANDAVAPITRWGGTPSLDTGHRYFAGYAFTEGDVKMWVDGTLYLTSNFNPVIYWNSPWDSQFMGETWNYGDNVPGLVNDAATFYSILYYPGLGYVYTPVTSAAEFHSGSSRYKFANALNNGEYDIWTDPQ